MFLWKDNGGDGVHINNGSDGGGDFIFKTDGDLRWEVVRKLRLVAIFMVQCGETTG
ncbi:phage tail fiber protein [Escherichia coli]|uniref:Phage tail fiber protein n=1 Tax=Escherichia coli TaxID=562 RepID=A0A377A3L9_ECOLX|nr:phage tail fiber protein [Escherichia coli]